ncbi:MAG: acyltransferase [Planctomycetota bacterium]
MFTRWIVLFSWLFPWFLRRRILKVFCHYELHPTSRIGFALIYPKRLIMEAHTRIDHLTVCKGLDLLHLKEYASIGKLNWITGYPTGLSGHYEHLIDRKPQLVVGNYSAITNRHLIDCTESVIIGEFSIVAGFQSQILTHAIDLELCRQSAKKIDIGNYCFVGTNCVLLGGSQLPDFSVLSAKSLLNKRYEETYWLYGGIPTRPLKKLSDDWLYFRRQKGFVQ